MNIPEDYKEANKDTWNKRTEVHVDSDFYDMKGFMAGRSSLNETELTLFGDVSGKSILHLQCHFGQDSLSLARMGAKVTAMDLSDKAIDKAREMNEALSLDASFVCCDLYDLPQHLEGQFDIVFTSYGVVGWLPDLQKWGNVINHFLKPGGQFIMVEFHPVMWMFNNDFTKIQYSYFNRETIIDETTGTYTDRDANISYREVSWNHSLEEVFSGLMQNGMSLSGFKEYHFSHYNCFANMKAAENNTYQITGMENLLPMMYSVTATKMNTAD